ncbi:MAG TPA: hypothetical protein VNI53_08040 [Gammaproteobacteria bacterium]|nr:hypothetical protein [Gammaproteobacteria bacterium]
MNNKTSEGDAGLGMNLALGKNKEDPQMDARAAEYLEEHIALAKAQQELLKIERERNLREAGVHDLHTENLRLHNQTLLAQRAQLRTQHRHERLSMIYQAVLSAVAVAILGTIVYAIYSAATDHSVIVNQFQVPPTFVSEGNNGTVIASEFLDQLQTLRASALATPGARALQGAWVNNIQLQIPQVHVSLGDIQRTLHSWLGHQIEINGEVVMQNKQIALTVRGTGIAARTYTGEQTDLHSLLSYAAEYVYVQAEPDCLQTMSKSKDARESGC